MSRLWKLAEVYSRITGYYRPVQNWNEGKTQEYKNRIVYSAKENYNGHLEEASKEAACSNELPSTANKSFVTISNDDVTITPAGNGVKYLFTTKTCPNCKIAKEYLSDEEYELIDAEENIELAQKYGVMQAPTLIVVNDDKMQKYVNASNIKKYVEDVSYRFNFKDIPSNMYN